MLRQSFQSTRCNSSDLTCKTSQKVWMCWLQGACVCRLFQGTQGRCHGGRGSVLPPRSEPLEAAHWGPLKWAGAEWGGSPLSEKYKERKWKLSVWVKTFLNLNTTQRRSYLALMSWRTWCVPLPWYSQVCLLFLTSWLLFTPRCTRKRWKASLLRSLNSSRLSKPFQNITMPSLFRFSA